MGTIDTFREAISRTRDERLQELGRIGNSSPSYVASTARSVVDDQHRKTEPKRSSTPMPTASAVSFNPLTIAQNQAKRLASTSVNLASRLYPFSQEAQPAKQSSAEEAGHGSNTPQAASVATIKPLSPHPYPGSQTYEARPAPASPSQSLILPGYGYPPSTVSTSGQSHDPTWTVSHWIHPSRALQGVTTAMRFARLGKQRHIRETVQQAPNHAARQPSEDSALSEAFQHITAAEVREDYLKNFAVNESEEVLTSEITRGIIRRALMPLVGLHGYLFRGLPVYGYLYVTSSHFCFRSTSIVAKTKVSIRVRQSKFCLTHLRADGASHSRHDSGAARASLPSRLPRFGHCSQRPRGDLL